MEKRFVTCLERKRSSTQASEMEGSPVGGGRNGKKAKNREKNGDAGLGEDCRGARRPRRRRTSLERCRKWPEYASRAPTRRRVRCSRRPKIARGRRVAPLLVLVSSQKVEISSRRSFWYGRCRKNRSPENFAGGEWFLTTIRLTGKYWEMGKVTGKKHGDRKETRSPEGFPDTLRRWRKGKAVEFWEAHKAAIQAVIKLPSNELITGTLVPGSYLLSRVVAVVLVGWYCIGVTGKGWMWWWWWWWWLQQQCSGGDSWMEMFFCSIGAGASGG
ncbi:hypothetical protein CK203_010725 [Vitis vinifera]|uniref:Uncharacterized protein n=1 Tax=Vitis vinifera TaxID=29760 RepID=A0A438JTG9_VITVI|nr:hypothetical protein CK203_010725 [Vitis vinifera]